MIQNRRSNVPLVKRSMHGYSVTTSNCELNTTSTESKYKIKTHNSWRIQLTRVRINLNHFPRWFSFECVVYSVLPVCLRDRWETTQLLCTMSNASIRIYCSEQDSILFCRPNALERQAQQKSELIVSFALWLRLSEWGNVSCNSIVECSVRCFFFSLVPLSWSILSSLRLNNLVYACIFLPCGREPSTYQLHKSQRQLWRGGQERAVQNDVKPFGYISMALNKKFDTVTL